MHCMRLLKMVEKCKLTVNNGGCLLKTLGQYVKIQGGTNTNRPCEQGYDKQEVLLTTHDL